MSNQIQGFKPKICRFVFFGTPKISAVILGRLIEAGMPPATLVCNPDRPTGRKQLLTPPPTKELIAKSGLQIEVLQPENPKAIGDKLKVLQPDFFVVAAYGKMIPKGVLDIPRLGTIGVHFSLLPKYRGASPLQTAILEGDRETGVSLYLLDEKMDEGPVLMSRSLKIGEKNFVQLSQELAELSADMLLELIPALLAGKAKPVPQDHSRASYTGKFTAADAFVDPQDLEIAEAGDEEKANAILRKIRALNPEPGVWTTRDSKRMKLLNAEVQNGKLILQEIQLEGEKRKYIQ